MPKKGNQMKARFDGSHYVFQHPRDPSERIALTPVEAGALVDSLLDELLNQNEITETFAFELQDKLNEAISYS